MTRRTLTGQLLAWVIATLAAVWSGFIVVGYLTGIEEADELSHAQLANVAELLLGDSATAPVVVDEYRSVLSFALWDADGKLLDHRGPASPPPFDPGEGFAIVRSGPPEVRWRSFSRWSSNEPRRKVMVLVDTRLVDELSWDMAGDIARPGLWLLPLAVLVLGAAVRRGLRPLAELGDEVGALDVRRPQPLPAVNRPDELQAVAGAIDALAARYQAALARERQLASEIAHELRTPLTAIALQANALRGLADGAGRDVALQRIEHDALRAGAVLNALLELARASHAEMADAARTVDLTALARRVTADHAQAALDSGHELGFDGDDTLSVVGHPLLLELALRNLIDNALAHTARGTTVAVQVSASERWLQVCDNGSEAGPGMSPRALGLGLGHRVVDKVAAMHGARFGPAEPAPGFVRCYRIGFGSVPDPT